MIKRNVFPLDLNVFFNQSGLIYVANNKYLVCYKKKVQCYPFPSPFPTVRSQSVPYSLIFIIFSHWFCVLHFLTHDFEAKR